VILWLGKGVRVRPGAEDISWAYYYCRNHLPPFPEAKATGAPVKSSPFEGDVLRGPIVPKKGGQIPGRCATFFLSWVRGLLGSQDDTSRKFGALWGTNKASWPLPRTLGIPPIHSKCRSCLTNHPVRGMSGRQGKEVKASTWSSNLDAMGPQGLFTNGRVAQVPEPSKRGHRDFWKRNW